jgi:hypothetical protein
VVVGAGGDGRGEGGRAPLRGGGDARCSGVRSHLLYGR